MEYFSVDGLCALRGYSVGAASMNTSDFCGLELQPIFPIPAIASNEHSMALFQSYHLSANDSKERSTASQHLWQLSVVQLLQLHSHPNHRQLSRTKVVPFLMHLTYAAWSRKIWKVGNEVDPLSMNSDSDFPSHVFLSISLQHLWNERFILDFNQWVKALNFQWQNLEQISDLRQNLVL